MSSIINMSISIDKLAQLAKDNPEKVRESKKGERFVNITICSNRDGEDKFGNTHYSIISQSKEEREAGEDKVYLGNGKEFVFGGGGQRSQAPAAAGSNSDSLPF